MTVGPVAVLVDGDYAGAGDVLGHRKAQGAHFSGQLLRRLGFLETQLRVGVDVLVERVQARIELVQLGVDRRLVGRNTARLGRSCGDEGKG